MAEVDKTAAEEKAGGKDFFAQEREERNQVPYGCFYKGARDDRTACAEGQAEGE